MPPYGSKPPGISLIFLAPQKSIIIGWNDAIGNTLHDFATESLLPAFKFPINAAGCVIELEALTVGSGVLGTSNTVKYRSYNDSAFTLLRNTMTVQANDQVVGYLGNLNSGTNRLYCPFLSPGVFAVSKFVAGGGGASTSVSCIAYWL